MKRTITIILLISMLLLLIFWFLVVDLFHMGKFRLSLLNNRQCKQFLLAQGITIPEEFNDYNFQRIITLIETAPNVSFASPYLSQEHFANEIRSVVNAYYGIEWNGGVG